MNKRVGIRNWLYQPSDRYRLSIFVLIAFLLAGCSRNSNVALPVPEVGVMEAAVAAIPLDLNYTAHTRGIREIEVRARVSGILLKRHYREGSYVNAGDLLFQIDPEAFAAEVGRAKGQLAVAQAQLNEATLLRNRMVSLISKQAVSKHEYDTAETRYQAALAATEAAKASLRRAELDLKYALVTAPISGFTSNETRSEGSLVEAGAESSLLTTITQDDRLYVEFSMPQEDARQVRAALAKHPDAVCVRLTAGGAEIPDTAKIEFIDARVAVDTSTVNVRAVYDNKRSKNSSFRLSSGQVMRVRLEGVLSAPAVHIPTRAVMFGAGGTFVWVLDGKNVVKPCPVKVGAERGNLSELISGLKAGDRVIVDGILKVQPDMTVKPVAAKSETPQKGQGGGAV